jgi:hypothetical protein
MQSRRQREDTGIAQGAKFTALAGLDRIVKLADSRCQSGRTLAQRFPQANPARYLIAGTSSGRSFGLEAHSLRGAQGKLGPVLSCVSFSGERTRIKRGTSFYNAR